MVILNALACCFGVALCSTILVHPWFFIQLWKKIFNNDIRMLKSDNLNYDETCYYNENYKTGVKTCFYCELKFFSITFAVAVFVHFVFNTRLTAYGFIVPFLVALVCQCYNIKRVWSGFSDKKKKILYILIGIVSIFCILVPVKNMILSYPPKVKVQREIQHLPFNVEENTEKVDEKTKKIYPMSEREIAKLCKASGARLREEFDNQCIYTLCGGETGWAVAVLNESGVTIYPIEYNGTRISFHLRSKYPYEEIVSMGIEVEDEVPFGKFALVSRPKFFGQPELKAHVMLNMVTGETKIKAE